MLQIFAGYDLRQEDGWKVFEKSLMATTPGPYALTPMTGSLRGTTAFTECRYLVPYWMGYKGMAIVLDGSDMMLREDLNKLAQHFDPIFACQVVMHEYKTTDKRKYRGSTMEADNVDYPRKNWTSVMLVNCAHRAWRVLTPETLKIYTPEGLHRLAFIEDRFIGGLPSEWNYLVGETYPVRGDAKLVHFTLGIPGLSHYHNSEYADEWRQYL